MGRVSTYLNFMGQTEEAFGAYASIFGTQLARPMMRMGEMAADPGMPSLSEDEKALVANAELPIYAGHVLMATDMLASMGHSVRLGNNVTVHLEVDSRAEADRLYAALAEGGADTTGLQVMPWGAYWGTCQDRFGVRWMFSCAS